MNLFENYDISPPGIIKFNLSDEDQFTIGEINNKIYNVSSKNDVDLEKFIKNGVLNYLIYVIKREHFTQMFLFQQI
jgi:hypothetical protein